MGTKSIRGSKTAGGEAQRLKALRRLGILEPADLVRFEIIVRTAALALDVAAASISIVESNDRWILSSHGMDAACLPRDITLRQQDGSDGDLFVIEDSRLDARFAPYNSESGLPAIGFYASCPLIGINQDISGALCVTDEKARRFDERSREVLRGFAVWAQRELNAWDRERARLEALNARLVAPAVHRMRGALTSIHGFSNFLLNQDCAPEQRQEVLGIIHDQASYLASVVTELIDLVYIEISAGRDLKFSARPAEEVLQEAVAAFDGGRVSLHIEEGLPPISVDKDHFRRALLRLLGYASDDSVRGGGIAISVTHADEPGYLAISVKHRYREATRPEAARIFEPFSPPNRDELHGASNIGLALTKEIIDLHGGKARISEDHQEHSVEVSLLLPIQT